MPQISLSASQQRVICRNLVNEGKYIVAAFHDKTPEIRLYEENVTPLRWEMLFYKMMQELPRENTRRIYETLQKAFETVEREENDDNGTIS